MKRFLSAAVFSLGAAAVALAQAPSIVQHKASDCGSATSCAVKLPAPTAQGEDIIAIARLGGATPTATITDDAGNAYGLAVQCPQSGDPHVTSIFFAAKAKPATTVTLAGAGSSTTRLAVLEAANAGGIDQTSCKAGSGSALDSGTITTTSADLVVAGMSSDNAETATAGTGFMLLDSANKLFTEFQVQAAAGAIDARSTMSPAPAWWADAVASFSPLPPVLKITIAGLGTISFPVTDPSQVPVCTAADGLCAIAVQVCDTAKPANCLASNAGTLSLVKTFALPVPGITTVTIVTVSPN